MKKERRSKEAKRQKTSDQGKLGERVERPTVTESIPIALQVSMLFVGSTD